MSVVRPSTQAATQAPAPSQGAEPVQGFVLAAGFGQRMLPITETIPKPLLPIGHVPLIGYSLRLLAHHGIHDVIVNSHHLHKALAQGLKDGSQFGVKVIYSHEEEILGTGGGVKKMHDHIHSTLVLINSDTVCDVDLTQVIAEHRRRRALATMVLRHDPQHEEGGRIGMTDDGRIVRVPGQSDGHGHAGGHVGGHAGEHASGHEAGKPFMFTGIHVLEPRFLEYLPPDVHTCIIRYGYVKALANKEAVYGTVMPGYWADAGTPQRYWQVTEDILSQKVRLPHVDGLGGYAIAPRRDVAEVVRMGSDVDLGAHANILPPVLLGDGSRIGEGATVGPGVVLGDKVHIGRDAVVTHCVLLEGARIEAGAHVHHMLMGKKESLRLFDAHASTGDAAGPAASSGSKTSR